MAKITEVEPDKKSASVAKSKSKSETKTRAPVSAGGHAQASSSQKQALKGVLVALGVAVLGYQGYQFGSKYLDSASPISSSSLQTPSANTPSPASSFDKNEAVKSIEDLLASPFTPLEPNFKPREPVRRPAKVPAWAQRTTSQSIEWPKPELMNRRDESGKGRIKVEQDGVKKELIKQAFKDSWAAYERDAWGSDEYWPLDPRGTNLTEDGSIGYTIVDSLDSLLLMGLEDEYERARDWVAESLDFDVEGNQNTFEVTIRVLGGLLSAHYLSSKSPKYSDDAQIYLEKATDLGERLLGAFQTPTGLPWSLIDLADSRGIPDKDNRGLASLAEVGTLQLELKYLSHLTGDERFWRKAERVMAILKGEITAEGVAPILIKIVPSQYTEM